MGIKLPKRKGKSHKGDNGVVLAVGGSENFPGAITLAGIAAIRSGCDLVKIIAPEKAAWAVNSYSPDLITIKARGKILSEKHFSLVLENLKNANVILFGCGIGLADGTKKLCRNIAGIPKLKVADADGIKAVSMDELEDTIVTPHSRELEIFLLNSGINEKIIRKISNEENIKIKSSLIQKTCDDFLSRNNIILLKGKTDLIISKGRIYFSIGGNPGMTKGGTGDVLAGLCAGYLAQSGNVWQSAVNASIINKKIGDILFRKKEGFTYLASDMAEEIGKLKNFKFQS